MLGNALPSPVMVAMLTETIFYSGHVQGVGFRYNALQTAREFVVTGTVQNMPDGRVKLVVQGQAGEVAAFRKELESRMASFIRQIESQPTPEQPVLAGFNILS